MKITKIFYQKTADNKILFISANNVSTFDEIETEFGQEVLRLYQKYTCYAKKTYGFNGIKIYPKGYHDFNFLPLKNNKTYSETIFGERIKLMKKAAQRLIKLRKKVLGYKIKCIEI